MAKILLVEDDNNLREIYEARLQAEGYEIVSAPDGEAALVVAKKEMPDLVISDVMMPRISGFEMLDIMRNTEGLKDVKVIMLTALGQAEDKTRADSLGADKYLVKSQVTLEDIVKSAAELLGGETAAPATPATAAAAAEVPAAAGPTAASAQAAPMPATPVAAPPATDAPTTPPPAPTTPATTAPDPVFAPTAPAPQQPAAAPTPAPAPSAAAPDLTAAPAPATGVTDPTPSSTDDQLVADAVKDLISGTPEATPAPPTPAPEPQPATTPPTLAPTPMPTPAAPEPAPAPATPAPEPTPQPQPVVPAPAPISSPATPQAPPAAPAQEADNLDLDDGSTVAKKKIISPLAPGTDSNQTPDLNELMAKEGHALDDQMSQETVPPHQPGHVISPNPVNSTGQPEDPNKISL